MLKNYQKVTEFLEKGGICVLPTDTIYGISGLALNKAVVEKIYILRKRKPTKPFIILISSEKDLEKFKIKVDEKNLLLPILKKSGISVIFSCENDEFEYLHRGTKSLAFRIPSQKNKRGRFLREILQKTGPLISTSVNFEGENPAQTIKEAKQIFGKNVDFYLSENRRLNKKPSVLVGLKNGKIKVLRGKLKF